MMVRIVTDGIRVPERARWDAAGCARRAGRRCRCGDWCALAQHDALRSATHRSGDLLGGTGRNGFVWRACRVDPGAPGSARAAGKGVERRVAFLACRELYPPK